MKILSTVAHNYMNDVFNCDSIEQIKPQAMYSIIENVEMDLNREEELDRELMEAYFAIHLLPPMSSEQFKARMC